MNPLRESFKNPGNAYRGKPFWSWNGKLEKKELLRQIDVMKTMGFGGYFMHSRTGLETEYLGDEWFELINACADYGKEVGMESWLYDEDRWPSGTAGGMVTKNPDDRMRFLTLKVHDIDGYEASEDAVAVFAADLDELKLNAYEVIASNNQDLGTQYNKILECSVVEMASSSFYNGYTYLDTMNPAAMDAYIQSTHEMYKEKCGDRLGDAIKGIFTDEPHRGSLMSTFGSEEAKGADKEWMVPWTLMLTERFESSFGYNILDRLPELFLQLKGQIVSQVKWHYVETTQQLFLDSFAKPYQAWCKKNNMVFTGHVLHEDTLTAQTAMSGSVMRFYEYMDAPGVDILSEKNKNYWVAKQVASVARQMGQKWVLSELYGCTGWEFSFEGHKNVGDWQALLGVNLRCHHLSWYTMKGQAKRDYPASILHQSTWWKDYKVVEDYFARFNKVMMQGSPVCDTLIINPVESVWSIIHPGWCDGLEAEDVMVKRLEDQYRDTFTWMLASGVDFDYGDEEMMGRLGQATVDAGKQPLLTVGQASYRRVVVSGMLTMRSTTLGLLKTFADAGGEVIFIGDAPEYVDAILNSAAMDLRKVSVQLPYNRDDVIQTVNGKGPITVTDVKGVKDDDILVQVRKDEHNTYMMLLNTDRENGKYQMTIEYQGEGYLQYWDLFSGDCYDLCKLSDEQLHRYTFDMVGGEELLLVVSDVSTGNLVKEELGAIGSVKLPDSFAYKLSEPNVCVLDMAKLKIDDGLWQPEEEILKIDKRVRDHFDLEHRSGQMLQPWFVNQHKVETLGQVTLAFDFEIKEVVEDNLYLVIEALENFDIRLNNQELTYEDDDDWWVDIAFKKIPLNPEILVKGINTLTMSVGFNQRIDLEAAYIIGNFGVEIQGSRKIINTLPEVLKVGDICEQKLPFYSGEVTYIIPLDEEARLAKYLELKIDDFGGALIKAGVGEEAVMLPWKPYTADVSKVISDEHLEVTYVLTRRNTFGPLHQYPVRVEFYGPDNFVTEGDTFTNSYGLLPTGMLTKPKLTIKE